MTCKKKNLLTEVDKKNNSNYMKPTIRFIILFSILTLSTKFIFGQKNCKETSVLGDWTMVNNFNFHGKLNLDSLDRSIDNSTKTLSVWTFRDNGTYDLKSDERNVKGHYKFLSNNCEIRLGQKKTTPEGLIFHILLIDEKHLIMKCTKPKGDFIYLHKRI